MPTVQPKARIECAVRCGMCGRAETIVYSNAKSIADLKNRTDNWIWRAKKGYNVCPECYAQHISRGRKAGFLEKPPDN